MPERKRVNVAKGLTTSTAPKPKLGQHFLASQPAGQRIVEALGDLSAATVLEIGPGRGALTTLLAARARRVIAVELDRVLAAQLRMKFAIYPNVEIIEGDILKIELNTVFGPKPGMTRPGLNFTPEPAHVIGNLPYYITSDILLRLLEYHRYFSTVVIMVQKEVADRVAASPGTRDYGLLSATAQLYARVEKLFTLPPGAFAPPPKVHSSVVRLTIEPRIEALQVPEAGFISFLKLSFGQKRKTLWNNLKTQYPQKILKEALAQSGVKPTVRAEALPLAKSAALYRALHDGKLV
ncbi:MAG: ribosomal RNA small subunit methyltransferase A [Acidobacteria bacterium]|jgi:16S rRNA (adenine1518-N6/adenine1519-N6)-dimethyltransferase|nr:MAG: ribosomal RNA small subunit methyltransferase A [Acidobacteriota bacterium]